MTRQCDEYTVAKQYDDDNTVVQQYKYDGTMVRQCIGHNVVEGYLNDGMVR